MVVFIWSRRFGETAKMRYEMFQLKIEMLLKCTDIHTFSTTAITFSGMIFLRGALKWAFNHLIVYINGDWMWRCQALTMAILLACVSLTLSNDKSIIRGWKKNTAILTYNQVNFSVKQPFEIACRELKHVWVRFSSPTPWTHFDTVNYINSVSINRLDIDFYMVLLCFFYSTPFAPLFQLMFRRFQYVHVHMCHDSWFVMFQCT